MAFNFLLCLRKKYSKSGKEIRKMLERRGGRRFTITLQTAPAAIRTVSLAGRGNVIKTMIFWGKRGSI